VNIIEAMDDPGVFQPWFAGASWDAWKAVLRAAFALPMSEADLATFARLAGGRKPPERRVRELWIVAGRRSGKDSIASGLAAWSAGIEQGHVGKLRPGELASVLCLACDRDQSRIVKGYADSYFTAIPELGGMNIRETRTGLELDNGAEIVIATNSYRQARGRTILFAIFDECAFWRDESSATPDIETYRAILPALATLPDAMLVGISSPYRKAGLLYDRWKAFYGQDDDRVLVIQAESIELNPTLDPALIAEALAADPAAARAEWLGQFRDDIAGFLDIELIEGAVDRAVIVRPPRPGLAYVGYVDAASGVGKDSFAAAVAHREGEEVIVDLAHEIRPPFNPQTATAEVAELFKSYNIGKVNGDKYSAGYNIEAFAKCGITYEYSERDTSQNYIETIQLFTSGRVRLVDNKRLVAQFAGLERRTSVAGRDRVDHGPNANSHDDISAAVAGVVAILATKKVPVKITPEMIAQISAFGRGERARAQFERAGDRRLYGFGGFG